MTWARGSTSGPAEAIPGQEATPAGTLAYPGNQGATNGHACRQPADGSLLRPAWVNYGSLFIKRPQTTS